MTAIRSTWSSVLLICIIGLCLHDVFAKHHHVKLRHERHRRQHGESYLTSSFVLDTDEPERGTWGPWSSPSSCSRTCGGGVTHQIRQCLDIDDNGYNRCTGASRRYFSCNIQFMLRFLPDVTSTHIDHKAICIPTQVRNANRECEFA
ncbi:PREDICTED: papilin-like [Eufriesea mexicana]|uniref:papilin-like n=1 Tax=Eufriesea mexicana TaxID=516756 RepID=UPI00083BD3A1|nr:PREDICTED: papilin-like [Eufriesea mexicana]